VPDGDDIGVELTEDSKTLLAKLPAAGTARGNTILRNELGWDEDQYLAARNGLIDAGLAQKWRGPGGSLRRVANAESAMPIAATEEESQAEYEAEKDLYDPMLAVIRFHWSKDARLENPVAAVIGHQGKKKTGGKWSRPDIVLVAVSEFPLVPGKHISVVTFEIKRGAALDVTAVYEALAHRRAATHSIVLVHADGLSDDVRDVVEAEAARHGVGMIVASEPGSYDTWDTRVEAIKVPVEPWALSSFLTVQLPAAERALVEGLL
jgi:hypothetical protein